MQDKSIQQATEELNIAARRVSQLQELFARVLTTARDRTTDPRGGIAGATFEAENDTAFIVTYLAARARVQFEYLYAEQRGAFRVSDLSDRYILSANPAGRFVARLEFGTDGQMAFGGGYAGGRVDLHHPADQLLVTFRILEIVLRSRNESEPE